VKIDVLGIPFNGDGTPPEVENPAQSLRQAGLVRLLQSKVRELEDLGDLPIPAFENRRDQETQVLNRQAWCQISERTSQKVATILEHNSFLLVLGGDCSILVGIFAAFARRNSRVGLVFLDGHTDFRAPATSPSGEPADIELAILTGREPRAISAFSGAWPLVRDDDVIVYGFREPDQIAVSDICTYDRKKIAEVGIEQSAKEGLLRLARKNIPLWLHFDVDVLDPSLMPVSFPETNGLTFDEVEEFLRFWLAWARVVGMSVTCYHPRLDSDGEAGRRLVALLANTVSIAANKHG
jgi:arginase